MTAQTCPSRAIKVSAASGPRYPNSDQIPTPGKSADVINMDSISNSVVGSINK